MFYLNLNIPCLWWLLLNGCVHLASHDRTGDFLFVTSFVSQQPTETARPHDGDAVRYPLDFRDFVGNEHNDVPVPSDGSAPPNSWSVSWAPVRSRGFVQNQGFQPPCQRLQYFNFLFHTHEGGSCNGFSVTSRLYSLLQFLCEAHASSSLTNSPFFGSMRG